MKEKNDEFEGMDNFDQVTEASLEQALQDMDVSEIDEFDSSINFEKFIVLSKKDLSNFCRVVEPLTKASIDDYGRSVYIECLDNDTVELKYTNTPYIVSMKVPNKSGKQVKPFAMLISNLKKLVTSAFASLVFVEENNDINLALCESLLFLETKPLSDKIYKFDEINATEVMDKEISTYTFKKVGAILSCSDRAAEKVIVIKGNTANFCTGFFAAKAKSPFNESQDFVIYKAPCDVLAVLSELSKVSLKYKVDEENSALQVVCDDNISVVMPIGVGDKVNEFYSPVAENALKFDASVVIMNDSLLRLITVVKSLEYLSDIVTIGFTKEIMEFVISTTNQSKKSSYKFNIVEGKVDKIGDIKISINILKIFFEIVGSDVKYSFTDEGLGIHNDNGKFLIRKN